MRDRVFRIVICSIAALIVASCSVFACFAAEPDSEINSVAAPFYADGLANDPKIPSGKTIFSGFVVLPVTSEVNVPHYYTPSVTYSDGKTILHYEIALNITADSTFRVYIPLIIKGNVKISNGGWNSNSKRFVGTTTVGELFFVESASARVELPVRIPSAFGVNGSVSRPNVSFDQNVTFAVFECNYAQGERDVSFDIAFEGVSVLSVAALSGVITDSSIGTAAGYVSALMSTSYIALILSVAVILLFAALLYNWLLSM